MKSKTLLAQDLPERLQQLPQPPKQMHCQGTDLDTMLRRPILGIVGARGVSPYGRTITADLARALARRGVVIVSGLALGVDSIAHRAALEASGLTIAVLPSGLSSIYPANHRSLAKQIIDSNGLLVSEYEPDATPHQGSFIARNRIIAGLCDGLLVTEAAEASGSLHTARFALEQGKVIMAVPGNITSPVSAGTNNLIKTGATPITSANDILQALNVQTEREDVEPYYPENELEAAIVTPLQAGPIDGHELLAASHLSITDFQQHLTMLELKDVIVPLGNNIWKLK